MSQAVQLLQQVLGTIREGNVPGPDELVAIEKTVREVSPGLDKDELRQLLGLVHQVQEAIVDEKVAIQQQLDRIGSERKALRGYSQLRSHQHSQRLNRKT